MLQEKNRHTIEWPGSQSYSTRIVVFISTWSILEWWDRRSKNQLTKSLVVDRLGDSRSTEKTDFSADDFKCFFTRKSPTCGRTPTAYHNQLTGYSSHVPSATFVGFQMLTVENVRKLIELASLKQCDLDP